MSATIHPFVEPRADESLYSRFLDVMRQFGRERDALGDTRQATYSYGELLKISLALGRMTSQFTAPREHVGVLMPNLASTLCLILGMNAFGRIPALLNYTAGMQALQDACVAAQVRTLITSRVFLQKAELEAVVSALKGVKLVYLEDMRAQFSWRNKVWLMAYALRFPS
ncbi:MAG TPA: bifunctional 2-acylglycerophosphoethanolamine acyltransferase/acyl-ACP synthetase, partial [Betaproteobacteria bacterium]|nr:bifunctional 2-acylglycerophosphoethanolamine acyltransferase/acyl-ACP synthetase [Betaproteobacteria bacterium]